MSSGSRNQVKIFDYISFAKYFSDYMSAQKKIRSSFSYRVICKATGIKSAAQLTWIAKGDRLPTPEILEKFNNYFHWRPEEYAFAVTMVNYEKEENPTEKKHYLERMRTMVPIKGLTMLEQAAIDIVMKWYIVAILEMTHLKDFQNNPQWIRARLGERVTIEEVEYGIKAPKETGLLQEDETSGQLSRPSKSIRTPENVPVLAVRMWHSEMMQLAQRALHLQPPQERFISGGTFTIDKGRIKEAQDLMTEFREKFIKLMQTDQGNETYHFALQFFRLTEQLSQDSHAK